MIRLLNKNRYTLPTPFEKYIVHSESGEFIDAYCNEDIAESAVRTLNAHNEKNGHPERFTMTLSSKVTIVNSMGKAYE